MSEHRRNLRFGLWYDFRNPAQWRQPADQLSAGLSRERHAASVCITGKTAD